MPISMHAATRHEQIPKCMQKLGKDGEQCNSPSITVIVDHRQTCGWLCRSSLLAAQQGLVRGHTNDALEAPVHLQGLPASLNAVSGRLRCRHLPVRRRILRHSCVTAEKAVTVCGTGSWSTAQSLEEAAQLHRCSDV